MLSCVRWRLKWWSALAIFIGQVGIDKSIVSLVDWRHSCEYAQCDNAILADVNPVINHLPADQVGQIDIRAAELDKIRALLLRFLHQDINGGLLEFGALLSEVEAAIFLELFRVEGDFCGFG